MNEFFFDFFINFIILYIDIYVANVCLNFTILIFLYTLYIVYQLNILWNLY
jgi:hypothetical protein